MAFMILRPSWLAFALLAPACAPAEGTAPQPPRPAPAGESVLTPMPAQDSLQPTPANPVAAGPCAIRVRFESYGPGIDTQALALVQAVLSEDSRVLSVTEGPWGREGERDLCVAVRGAADAGPLAARVIGVLPPPPRPGPVEVVTAAGRFYPAKGAR